MLTIHQLDYRIDARPLFENASAQIASGWKVGLVGRNGAGKSTLLRLILEEIEAPSRHSSISLNKGARVGVVTQEVAPDDHTIIDVVLAASTCSDAVSNIVEISCSSRAYGRRGHRGIVKAGSGQQSRVPIILFFLTWWHCLRFICDDHSH